MKLVYSQRYASAMTKCPVTRGEVDLSHYKEVDGVWRELGLAAPARRALVDHNILKVRDLKKFSLDEIADFHGIGPNALKALKKVYNSK